MPCGRNCRNFECPLYYKCKESYCIPRRHVCDGVMDCPTGQEEMNCNPLQKCLRLFWCPVEKICLSLRDICDGWVHCLETNADEIFCDVTSCPEGRQNRNNQWGKFLVHKHVHHFLSCNNVFYHHTHYQRRYRGSLQGTRIALCILPKSSESHLDHLGNPKQYHKCALTQHNMSYHIYNA